MTAEHFREVFYTIMMSTKSSKRAVCRSIGFSQPIIDKYLREGLDGSKKFLILDRLENYLFANLGGKIEYANTNEG